MGVLSMREGTHEPFAQHCIDKVCQLVEVLGSELVIMQVAFSSISTALRFYLADMKDGFFRYHYGVIDKVRGSFPNDPSTFLLKDHFAIQTDVPSAQALGPV